MTLEDIVDDIFIQLKEVKGTDIFWTEDEVKAAANDACNEIADRLMCFRTSNIIKIVAETRSYDISLADDYLLGSLSRVEFDGERIWPISIAELDSYNENWRVITGDRPTHYIMDLESSLQIDLYPQPNTTGTAGADVITTTTEDVDIGDGIDATARIGYSIFEKSVSSVTGEADPTNRVNNLETFFAKYPARLTDDSSQFLHPVTNNPQKVLTKGAMSILLMKEGEGKDVEKAGVWYRSFLRAIKLLTRFRSKGMVHRMRSISGISIASQMGRGRVNLGQSYPSYYFR